MRSFRSRNSLFALMAGLIWIGGCRTPKPPLPGPAPEPPPAAKVRNVPKLPRVMLVVDENSMGTIATSEIETMGARLLLDHQVQVVDQDMVRSNIGKGQQVLKSVGDSRGAAALGLQFGSDVIIVGEAVSKPSARRIADSNLRTYQASVSLRAIRTDSSVAIASISEEASVIGLDDVAGSAKALKAAGQKTLEALIPKMLDAWEKNLGSPTDGTLTHIVVTVGGMDQLWKVKAFRDQVGSLVPQVRNLVQRSYTAGVAVFELDTPLSAEKLGEQLVLEAPQDLKLQVVEIGQGKIDLRAVATK